MFSLLSIARALAIVAARFGARRRTTSRRHRCPRSVSSCGRRNSLAEPLDEVLNPPTPSPSNLTSMVLLTALSDLDRILLTPFCAVGHLQVFHDPKNCLGEFALMFPCSLCSRIRVWCIVVHFPSTPATSGHGSTVFALFRPPVVVFAPASQRSSSLRSDLVHPEKIQRPLLTNTPSPGHYVKESLGFLGFKTTIQSRFQDYAFSF